ncbi:MAG: cation transporter, partial [Bacteroidota bacterium]
MKNIITICLALCLFGYSPNIFAQKNAMDHFTVQVDGLGCPFCAYGLEKQFKALKGIKKIKIELEAGLLDFRYPTEKSLSIEQVEQQVQQAGYTPVHINIERADGSIEQTSAPVLAIATVGSYTFFVAGSCGMCKARIEAAAYEVEGIQMAIWDEDTQQLSVEITSVEVLQTDVEAAVAKAGYDTKSHRANLAAYEDLPDCC